MKLIVSSTVLSPAQRPDHEELMGEPYQVPDLEKDAGTAIVQLGADGKLTFSGAPAAQFSAKELIAFYGDEARGEELLRLIADRNQSGTRLRAWIEE